MKFINFIFVVILSCAITASAQEKPSPVKSGSVFRQNAVTVRAPKEKDWKLIKSNKDETFLEKSTKKEILFANVKTVKIKHIAEERELLSYLESMKKEELVSKYIRDSLHFNYVRYKETPCVQYDGVFNFKAEDKSPYEYFNFKGYLCRHPKNDDLIVQMEYSNHSNVRSFSKDFTEASNQFFEQTTFSKKAVK